MKKPVCPRVINSINLNEWRIIHKYQNFFPLRKNSTKIFIFGKSYFSGRRGVISGGGIFCVGYFTQGIIFWGGDFPWRVLGDIFRGGINA